MKISKTPIGCILTAVMVAICLSVAGCSDDSNAIGKVEEDNDHDYNHDHDHEEGVLAWIWGYDADSGALTAYHSDGGRKRATFAAHIHPMIKIAYAPSDSRPTLWMASGQMAQAFTTGFFPHMDHGHMATPEKHAALSEVHRPAHISVSPDGGKVIFANDENSTLTVADAESGEVTAVISHGSPHSAALMTNGGLLVTTHMTENWAKVVEVPTDKVLETIDIGSGAHGDVHYPPTDQVFIACVEGIEVIDPASMTKVRRLDYPTDGRTSFLYHGGDNPVAVGLHNLMVDEERRETDKILLLDMESETLEALALPGASVDWSNQYGRFAVSKDGKTAVLSDLNASRLYLVDIDPASANYRSVTTIPAPEPGVAVGAGEAGDHLFILSGDRAYPVDAMERQVRTEDGFPVKAGTDWIYVTSFSGELIDESVDKGDAVLNPEDQTSET